jgi:hypothetical protein
MSTRAWTDPYQQLAERLTRDRGKTVVALVLREEAADIGSTGVGGTGERWDLLVVADWFGDDAWSNLETITEELRRIGGTDSLLMLSRVLPLRSNDPVARELLTHEHEPFIFAPYLTTILGMQRVRTVLIFGGDRSQRGRVGRLE